MAFIYDDKTMIGIDKSATMTDISVTSGINPLTYDDIRVAHDSIIGKSGIRGSKEHYTSDRAKITALEHQQEETEAVVTGLEHDVSDQELLILGLQRTIEDLIDKLYEYNAIPKDA